MSRLDLCWKNCLRMWKWIAKNWKKGMDVLSMKREWLIRNGFASENIFSNCFFCDYVFGENKGKNCEACPGMLVHPQFHCQNKTYDYCSKPKKFYAKLLHLNAKRKAAK